MSTKEAEAYVTYKSDQEYETCEIHEHLTPHGRLDPSSPIGLIIVTKSGEWSAQTRGKGFI